jgi:hypothetical protein
MTNPEDLDFLETIAAIKKTVRSAKEVMVGGRAVREIRLEWDSSQNGGLSPLLHHLEQLCKESDLALSGTIEVRDESLCGLSAFTPGQNTIEQAYTLAQLNRDDWADEFEGRHGDRPMAILLSTEEQNLLKQWWNAIQDLNPAFLAPMDEALYWKLCGKVEDVDPNEIMHDAVLRWCSAKDLNGAVHIEYAIAMNELTGLPRQDFENYIPI